MTNPMKFFWVVQWVPMRTYIYIYIYICMYVCISIYVVVYVFSFLIFTVLYQTKSIIWRILKDKDAVLFGTWEIEKSRASFSEVFLKIENMSNTL